MPDAPASIPPAGLPSPTAAKGRAAHPAALATVDRPELLRLDLVDAFLAGRKPTTLRAYRQDLDDFARWLGEPTASAAADRLTSADAGTANAAALAYRAELVARGLAPATIARRLAALRSIVKLARTLGRVGWSLEIQGPRSDPYRDTRGPGLDGWRRLLDVARSDASTVKGRRDLALVRLLHDLALRRGEAVGLDVADVDLEAGTVAIVGKGKLERSRLTLNGPARAELADWLKVHPGPSAEHPLFVRLDRAAGDGPAGRLTGANVARIVKALGRRAGLSRDVRPHGLRHQSISRALDLSGGDVRRVQRFSRHAKVETLLRYDDNRRDDAGELARMLGDDSG